MVIALSLALSSHPLCLFTAQHLQLRLRPPSLRAHFPHRDGPEEGPKAKDRSPIPTRMVRGAVLHLDLLLEIGDLLDIGITG